MSKQLPPSSDLTKLPTEAQREEQLMQDILLLLKNMVYREEETVKLILNCLYDVGSTNLINQKFQSRNLKRTLKWISKMSKPAFKMIFWQWFKMKSPQLITDWLRTQIEFKKVETPKVEIVVTAQGTNFNSLDQAQNQMYELKQLRSQVKFLIGILVVIVTVLTSSFVWAGYLIERSHLQVIKELQTQVKTLEASLNKP